MEESQIFGTKVQHFFLSQWFLCESKQAHCPCVVTHKQICVYFQFPFGVMNMWTTKAAAAAGLLYESTTTRCVWNNIRLLAYREDLENGQSVPIG